MGNPDYFLWSHLVGDGIPILVDLGIVMSPFMGGNQVICVYAMWHVFYIYNDHSFYDLVSRTLFA